MPDFPATSVTPGSQDAADLAAIMGGRFRARNNKIALAGHSMNALFFPIAISANSRDVRTNTIGHLIHLENITKGRYAFTQDNRFAVPGVRIAAVNNTPLTAADGATGANIGRTQLQAVVACSADVVRLRSLFNDITNGTSLADIKTGYTTFVDTVVKAGKRVQIDLDPPRGAVYRASTANALTFHGALDWIQRVLMPNYPGSVSVVDTWRFMVNADAASAGDSLATVLQADGAHPNNYGGWLEAAEMKIALDRLGLPFVTPAFHRPGEVYDATGNPGGNLVKTAAELYVPSANRGSAAATSGGVTFQGERPGGSSYFANSAMQGGTLTVTGEMVTNNGRGDWWQTTISGNTGATAGAVLQIFLPSPVVTDLVAGDILQHMAEYEIDAGGTGLYGAGLQMRQDAPSWVDTICQHDGSVDAGVWDPILAAGLVEGCYPGNLQMMVKSGITGLSTSVVIRLKENTAINLKYRIRKNTVRKMQSA